MNVPSPPPPDVAYPGRVYDEALVRPSWSSNPGYLDDGHRRVFEETKDISGWQHEGDTYKLYEMASFAGDVILDLGAFGGRSAIVELKGAASRPRAFPPQVYCLDIEQSAIDRTREALRSHSLSERAVLFLGSSEAFFERFDIGPTMVFVDADHRYEGVRRDLDVLSRVLAPNVPVLCHDYINEENDTGAYGVRRAVQEWEESGHARFLGIFGCSALMLTTDRCRGSRRRLPDSEFASRRNEGLRSGTLARLLSAVRRSIRG